MSTFNWHLVHQTDCKYCHTFVRHACEKLAFKKNKKNRQQQNNSTEVRGIVP